MNRGDAPTISMDRVALELVGLDSKCDPHEQIKILCRKLQDHDFLPDPMAHEAMLTLSGRTLSPNSPLVQETIRRRERSLVEAVEQFADEFFSIPPADRLVRWNELAEACKGKSWLIGRLLGLKSGLKIDARSFVDASPVVRRLLEDLLELFPLRPSSHGIESRARASRFRNDPSVTATERARALKTVRRRYHAIASLSRGHLETLERPSKPQETQGWWARLVRIINVKFEEQPQLLVLMIGCLMATLLLLGWIARPDPRSQPSPSAVKKRQPLQRRPRPRPPHQDNSTGSH